MTIKNAIFLTCILATALLPQDRPPFRSNVEIVVVPCTVIDEKGIAVGDLAKEEFQVYDNDVRRPIENLWVDSDLPLTLGVIIDSSESQKEQISEHRKTAQELLQQILMPGDRSFVISVNEDIRVSLDPTDSVGELLGEPCPKRRSTIPGLGPWSVCGPSPLWNAIFETAHLKLRPLTGNKALLILTDGFDTGSTHTWNQAAEAVNRADTSLYVIQYRSGLGGGFAPDLNRLIVATAGTRFRAPEGDYRQIISRLQTDLRHRYILGFRPEQLSAKVRHEVRIEVTRPNLTVRARKTYFR